MCSMTSRIRQDGLVSGRVQGVAYRAYCVRCAQSLGITGHAQNLPDGRVHVAAYGDAENLEIFWAHLREGPPLARVDRILISNCNFSIEPKHFEIVF